MILAVHGLPRVPHMLTLMVVKRKLCSMPRRGGPTIAPQIPATNLAQCRRGSALSPFSLFPFAQHHRNIVSGFLWLFGVVPVNVVAQSQCFT